MSQRANDPPASITQLVVQALEAECGFHRELCAWCQAIAPARHACLMCNRRGYTLVEVRIRDFMNSTDSKGST